MFFPSLKRSTNRQTVKDRQSKVRRKTRSKSREQKEDDVEEKDRKTKKRQSSKSRKSRKSVEPVDQNHRQSNLSESDNNALVSVLKDPGRRKSSNKRVSFSENPPVVHLVDHLVEHIDDPSVPGVNVIKRFFIVTDASGK
jgi:hypothetical protein